MKKLLFLFLVSISLNLWAQKSEIKYADKSYYLVDSLDLSQLNSSDSLLLDSCLKEYHKVDNIIKRIKILEIVCSKMINEYWGKYQFFQYKLIEDKIKLDPDLIFDREIKKMKSNALFNLGHINQQNNNLKQSLILYFKALKIDEQLNNQSGIAGTYNNLGTIYYNQNNDSVALVYYHKSLNYYLSLDDKMGQSRVLGNIGQVYETYNISKSLEFNHKALRIEIEIKKNDSLNLIHDLGIASSYNNIGFLHERNSSLDSAFFYYSKSLKIYKKLNNKAGLSKSYLNICNTLYLLGDLTKAKTKGLIALSIASELKNLKYINESSNILCKIAQKQGNYKEAFEMYQLEIQMRDSITNEKNYKTVIQQQTNYEYEKKKAEDSIVNAQAKKVQFALLEAEKAKTEKKELALEAEKRQKWYLYIGLALLILFSGFMYNRFQFIKKQRQLIKEQKNEVEKSHKEIEVSHKEITDSINYAERIQRSFLATKENLDENLKDYFIFFQPKEAVSGDFYWSHKFENNNFAFTVADSTGHGVPGAIMSLLNITSLEKSVETETEPHLILNKTRETIIKRLKYDGTKEGGKDGMDCSLLVLNSDKTELTFASANNPVIIIRNNELLEFKGDKMPVGKHDKENVSFSLQKVQLQKGDVIYALTDGFQDQFGGPKGKKYMIKKLKNKFIEIANKPMRNQKEILSQEFNNWKGELEQIDDVCIIGVRV